MLLAVFHRRGAHFRPQEPRLPLDVVLASHDGYLLPCRCARHFFDRLRGLIGTEPQSYVKEVLLLTGCSSIHTNGMSYPIDVLFIDTNPCDCKPGTVQEDGRVVGTARVLASYRAVPAGEVVSCAGSRAVVERPASQSAWPAAGDVLTYVYQPGGTQDVEGIKPLVRT